MSQHPSLKSSDRLKQHRSVLKRYERLRILKEKGEWADDDSVYGLPKLKIVRFKIKKEKAEAAAEEGAVAAPGAEGAALPGAQSAATPAKPGQAKPGQAKPAAEAKKPEAKEAKPKK